MRMTYFIIGLASVAAFTIGSLELLSQESLPTQPTKNLGVVEFTNSIPQYFSLGNARSCTATAKRAPANGIEVDFLIQVTNSDGTVYPLGEPKLIVTIPDQYGEITSGGVSIKLKPKLKTP